jgi:hypothetical protein
LCIITTIYNGFLFGLSHPHDGQMLPMSRSFGFATVLVAAATRDIPWIDDEWPLKDGISVLVVL